MLKTVWSVIAAMDAAVFGWWFFAPGTGFQVVWKLMTIMGLTVFLYCTFDQWYKGKRDASQGDDERSTG